MKMRHVAAVVSVCAALTAQAVQTAGDLLVDLDAADLVLAPSDKVGYWPNMGTLGGYYTNVTAGQGGVFNADGGVTNVVFLPNSNWSVMTNVVAVPASICGSEPWSFEIWVKNPNLSQTEIVFSWTARNNWPGGLATGTCLEFRYGGDAGNAVEHYGNNVSWNGAVPTPGLWHHVACTRDAEGREKLFVNGVLRQVLSPLIMRIRTDGVFSLGGARNLTGTYDSLFGGSIARLRIHDGTLGDGDVVANYLEERAAFGVSDTPDSVWAGAADAALPWETAANWADGALPGLNSRVAIANGGTSVLTTAVGEIGRFFPYHGTLVMSNNAVLVAPPKQAAHVQMGINSNNLFNLMLKEGVFHLPDATNGNNLYLGNNAGTGVAVVGGGSGSAVLDVGRDLQIGVNNYSTGRLTVETGGEVYASNGWIYVGASGIANAKLTVNGGFVGHRTRNKDLVIGHNNSYSVLEVNGGVVAPSLDIQFTRDAASARCYGALQLNGGLVQARRFYGQNTTGTNILFFNGGTIRNRDSRGDFLYNLDWAYVQPGGAVIDILPNTAVTAAQALLSDPTLGDGGLTKSGNGTLTLTGANTITGGVTVAAGHLYLNNAAGLPAGYAAPVTLAAGASIGYNKTGGANELLALIPAASPGGLVLYANNAAENIDLSGYPNLGLSFASGVTYTGTYTPYNHAYRFAPAGAGNVYGQTITDGAGTATVTVEGLPDGVIELTADNSYSGGTTILGGMLSMAHANALGVPAATPDIGLYNGAALKLNSADIPATIVARIKPDSDGCIILGAPCASLNLDLTGLPGVRVGSDQTLLTYGGVITPEGNVYRTGGGRVTYAAGGYRCLVLTNLVDDGANARTLVIDGFGMVNPSGTLNTFSGGTIVTNGGALHLREDGGLGAAPAAPDPDNVYVDGGVIRVGDANFTLNANRGVTVGPNGMGLHPWGGRTMTVNGDLHGSGAITNTDSGAVSFNGTGNTYSGMLTLNTGTINIGNGANFSWNPAARINGIGGTLNVNHNSELTWSSNLGSELGKDGYPNFAFRKQGRGTLTADVTQQYTGTTTIDAGTLKVAAPEAVPTGHNRGNVTLNNQNYNPVGTIDVNGFDIMVNGLYGAGAITDSSASAALVSAGNNNQFSNFRGPVAPSLTLAKIGSASMLLSKGARLGELALVSGSITNAPGVEVAGAVTTFANTTLYVGAETNETVGLLGEYFDFSNTALRWIPHVTNFVTLARITEVLAPYAPATIAMSSVSNVFSFGSNGALFHNRGDYRVGRWTGKFYAATAGEYGFNTLSDDGSMVFVNGLTVVSNNFNQGYTSVNPKVLTPITLEVGWHDIIVAYFNGTGGYGLTLFMTPPGGVAAELPQNLLRPAPVRAGALTGSAASRTLFHSASAALQVGDDGEDVYDGLVKATNALNLVEKVGAGTQTLRRLDFAGLAQAKEGALAMQGSPMYGGAVQAFNAGASVYDGATLRVEAHADDWPNAGLAGSYYNIPNFGGGTFASIPSIESYFLMRIPDHHYGTHLAGANFTLNPNSLFPPPYNSGAYNDLQVLFQGKLVIREAGSYAFRLVSDDRSDLFINGVQVIADARDKTSTTSLAAGTHDMLVPWQQGGGGYNVRMYWTPPGGTSVELPNAVLRPCVAQTGPLAATAGGAVSLADPGSFLRVNETSATTLAGAIDGPVGSEIEKAGAAALTLTGDNDAFHGNWFISAGELWAGDGLTSGTLGGSNVYVSGGAALVFNRSDDIVYAGSIAGRGQIRSAGTGKVKLTGDATGFLGSVEVGAGQSVTLERSVLSTNATVNNAGTFGLSSARAFFAGTRITGAGETRLSEGATLGLGALDVDFPNTLAVSNGVLALAVTNANDTWQLDRLTLDAGTTLEVLPSGLFGRYYDIAAWNTDVISNAFLSVASAEAYLATQAYTFSASTWLLGGVLDFGTTGNFFPGKYSNATGSRKTNFAASWKGRIRVTDPGLYTFATSSDDHSMLFINGALVVDNNGNHGIVTRTGTVELAVGLHDFDLFFTQGGGGYGLTVTVTLPGQTAAQRLPNDMLVAAVADTPAYVLTVDTVAITNGPGVGTVAFAGPGTLKMTDLWIDTGAELAVTGAVACAGATLTVTVPQEVDYGVTYVGDFRGTDGLDVSGVTLAAVGTDGSLRYREKRLYIARATGTILILR